MYVRRRKCKVHVEVSVNSNNFFFWGGGESVLDWELVL